MYSRIIPCLAGSALLATLATGQQTDVEADRLRDDERGPSAASVAPADQILQQQSDPRLRDLIAETLHRNAGLAAGLSQAHAAQLRAPRAKAVPDPVAGVTGWLKSPETRTGPQILTLSLSQSLPWLGKFDLEEQAAVLEAGALFAEVEAARLAIATEIRRLYYELAFLARFKEISLDFVDHLRQHEEISQARYATGLGSSQDVLKIQAEITRAENRLLEISTRRVGLEARINTLRDRPPSAMVIPGILPAGAEMRLDYPALFEAATAHRPELTATDARIAAAQVRGKRAGKQKLPNFSIGLTYTFVDPRQDPAGIALPPDGNGDDIFGIQGGISIPLWRKSLAAGVEEAGQLEQSAREERRGILAEIRAALGDFAQRIPLTWQQLRLLEDILILQAEESVHSAESGYVAGTHNALDLLDAEHVLFDTETAIARAKADYAIRLAQLEGEVGQPLPQSLGTEKADS